MADDSDQWTSLLDGHLPTLLLFARQWVPSRSDAEDVVQEGFVRFWRARHRVSEPIAYFYACVRHVAVDWHRNGKRRLAREQATARPDVEPLFVDPLEQGERRAVLETALSSLPECQREVLVMRIWGELSFPQIAIALEISIDTAKSRHRYAVAKLRDAMRSSLFCFG